MKNSSQQVFGKISFKIKSFHTIKEDFTKILFYIKKKKLTDSLNFEKLTSALVLIVPVCLTNVFW